MKKIISTERAIEILNPQHREHYGDLPDGTEQVKDACRMGMEALQTIYPLTNKPPEYVPTNAEMMVHILADVVANGVDEDGYPNVEYEEIVCLTQCIACPYYGDEQPLCALYEENKSNPEAYVDCDACKAHWLMERWNG